MGFLNVPIYHEELLLEEGEWAIKAYACFKKITDEGVQASRGESCSEH